ncbi:MAG: ATP-binding protein [Thermodesulfobacteriota bacterium]
MKGAFTSFNNLRHSLGFKLILTVGVTLLLSIGIWAFFNIKYQQAKLIYHIVADADRLSHTIILGTHDAMLHDSRGDIARIIENIGRQKELRALRIYNKDGVVKYSSRPAEIDQAVDIQARVCSVCHLSSPPLSQVDLAKRAWFTTTPKGSRQMEIVTPIRNEPRCTSGPCHIHSGEKKFLGALNLIFSLEQTEKEILHLEKGIIALAGFVFLVTSTIIFVFVMRFVNLPIKKLIIGTHRIAKGNYLGQVDISGPDEMGQLAAAINKMGQEIWENQAELNRQRNEYQSLFDHVPCLITVQDKDYRLIGVNREFSEKFRPTLGEYCYQVYKGRSSKCSECPVEQTFKDGMSHYAEETGSDKDGTVTHWIVKTAPIRNINGEIVAAMEMSVDITHSRMLEEKLEESERKYHEIFNNMPNPAFVLDGHKLQILDCNQRVKNIYGFSREELIQTSFLDLFKDKEMGANTLKIRNSSVLHQATHLRKTGETIYVDIWISPLIYEGQLVFLVTTSDITQRLETEQQLIQAGKMATLGEMATGVAHELNQPLSVIKTASSFCIKKIQKNEEIADKTLFTMLNKIDGNVDRATKIITHMRQFARKTDMNLVKVQINDILQRAFEIFSQQLKLRGIEVAWHLAPDLPLVTGDPDRLEQVFINLILNAREAMEEKSASMAAESIEKRITLKTAANGEKVTAEVCDTGIGIPKAVADKIFEPFFTTKEVGKGTGLGLSISYGIVKDCGGTIRVKSESGQGACFIITFPLPNKAQ